MSCQHKLVCMKNNQVEGLLKLTAALQTAMEERVLCAHRAHHSLSVS